MPASEAEPIPLSAIEHYAYCPRQYALIHTDGQWVANAHTAHGSADHATVDAGTRKVTRDGVMTWLSLPVWHDGLNLTGVCDAVEFPDAVPIPVEYKPHHPRGRSSPAAQQLAAQAMCLESMLGVDVLYGVLFAHHDRRRTRVEITAELRVATLGTIQRIRRAIEERTLPARLNDARCRRCSLAEICQPAMRPHLDNIFAVQAENTRW